jgi:hypothetical protein
MASFATQITNIVAALHSAHTVIDATTGETYEHAQLIRSANSDDWLYSTANESDRLTKGILPHMPSGTETMAYISHDAKPPGRKATYARFVATERPHKTEKKHVRITVGGMGTSYITPTKSAPPQPTSAPSKLSSTSSSPPQVLAYFNS